MKPKPKLKLSPQHMAIWFTLGFAIATLWWVVLEEIAPHCFERL